MNGADPGVKVGALDLMQLILVSMAGGAKNSRSDDTEVPVVFFQEVAWLSKLGELVGACVNMVESSWLVFFSRDQFIFYFI